MAAAESLWDLEHRVAVLNLVRDGSRQLGVPLMVLLAPAMNYLHQYFGSDGRLNLSLFQLSIIAVIVACKTEELQPTVDQVTRTLVDVAAGREISVQEILGTSSVELESLRKFKSTEYLAFREEVVEAEMDFLNAIGWTFRRNNPFLMIRNWTTTLVDAMGDQYSGEIRRIGEDAVASLCVHAVYGDSLTIHIEDLAGSAMEFAWERSELQDKPDLKHWSGYVGYTMKDEVIDNLLARLRDWGSSDESSVVSE
jgi:hypothetical protein